MRSPLAWLLLLCVISLVSPSPFRIDGRVPVFYKRIPHRYPPDVSPFVRSSVMQFAPVLWRARRSQPILDYTDEFSADPFEMALSVSSTSHARS